MTKIPISALSDLEAHKPRAEFETHTHISLRNDYIYFQVSKAASSTVKFHLQSSEYAGTHFTVQDVNNKYLSPHLSPFQLKDSHLLHMLADRAVRKVAFVRNPYSRLLSCYLHRIVGEDSPSRRKLFRQMKRTDAATIGFQEFITFICSQSSADMDGHWRVQTKDIFLDHIAFDFIGKVENLSQDLRRLQDLLFGRVVFDCAAIERVNLAPMRTDASVKLNHYFSDRTMALVVDRFRSDFSEFNYGTDLPA